MSPVFHSLPRADLAVIGATGFIGSALVREAKAKRREVAEFSSRHPAVADGKLRAEIRDASHVVWSASLITPAVANEDPNAVAAEFQVFDELVSALEREANQPRLVLLSSGGTVYGGGDVPYAESTRPQPVNAYGEARLALEQRLHDSSLPGFILRLANAYGPGQKAIRGQGVIGHWLQAVYEGSPLTIFGDGSSARDYVYIDDIVQAIMRAADSDLYVAGADTHVVNIGSGRATTLSDLANLLRAVVGKDVEIDYRPQRGFDASVNWLDISLAKDLLTWEPQTRLVDGLAHAWEWFRATR
ncbi:NAD-dependent epimerase/dehydratase family protein [Gulosibacter sediminis]|uniref:NAD-dependent epimerase/dehydratase family protein n=1 Tax=Gulosibacter sediminis TaxID=1729695 RepID=UPI0024AE3C27|nr:NAD-dependent epimerase/dehydratase family protein [Gulosibacter sediminis]